MTQIQPIDPAVATGATAEALAAIRAKLGRLPNLFTTLAHSPAALLTYVKVAEALAAGRFSAKQREAIALAVGEANACGYCLAAHTAIGGMVGLKPAEIAAAREARSADPRDDAVLRLARRIVDARGNVDAADLRAARDAGLVDEDILETLAVVTLNIFTNYANHIAATAVDFPAVALPKAA